jgi:tetratricopeptide (TPR) repeat protein
LAVAVIGLTSSPSLANSPSNADGTFAAVQAGKHNRYAIGLANRGAAYSARVEFIQALTIVAQAQDMRQGSESHSKALVDGLTALDEVDTFAVVLNSLTVESDVSALIAGHRTPVLKTRAQDPISVLEALQAYFDYAERQLTYAAGGEPVASEALYGLAMVHVVLPKVGNSRDLTAAKSMVLNRAAFQVDPANLGAGNELAVSLARYGHLDQAEAVLRQTLQHHERPECWHNLAKVYERQGKMDLARQAQQRSDDLRAANGGENDDRTNGAAQIVSWVDMSTFIESGSTAEAHVQAALPTEAPIHSTNVSEQKGERTAVAKRWLLGLLPGRGESRPVAPNRMSQSVAENEKTSQPGVVLSRAKGNQEWSSTK